MTSYALYLLSIAFALLLLKGSYMISAYEMRSMLFIFL